MLGAVLFGDRRVRTLADGYDIERTPASAVYHPIEMYAMGKRQPSEVPDFSVFSDQAQFSPDTAASPVAGTRLRGDAQRVSIYDVIRIHGTRAGPVPVIWRRALVVISRDCIIDFLEGSIFDAVGFDVIEFQEQMITNTAILQELLEVATVVAIYRAERANFW